MSKTRYVHGQDFSWLIDVKNLQNVSELANPKCFNGSKPHPWVPSVLRVVVTYAIVPVLCISWAKTTTGWYNQFIWYCPPDYGEPYTLMDAIAKGAVLSPWYLILMGGGITGVVCTASWLIPGLYETQSLRAWSEFFDQHRKLAKGEWTFNL